MNVNRIIAMAVVALAVLSIVVGVTANLQPYRSCEDLAGADGVPGYTDEDQGWAAQCYPVICETEWGADGVAGYSENDEWFAAACYSGTSVLDWSTGIFSVLTIVAGLIVATAGARLVYVDTQYEKIIDKHRASIDSVERDMLDTENVDERAHLTEEWVNQHTLLTNTENKREDNRRNGIILDIISISGIIIFGIVISSGIFEDVGPMVILSAVLAVAPVTHFLRHMFAVTGRFRRG